MPLDPDSLRDDLIAIPDGSDPTAAADAWVDVIRDFSKTATANLVPVLAPILNELADTVRPLVYPQFIAKTGSLAIANVVHTLWNPSAQVPPKDPVLYFPTATAVTLVNGTVPDLAAQLDTVFAANTAGALSKADAAAAIAAVIYGWMTLATSITVTFPGPPIVTVPLV